MRVNASSPQAAADNVRSTGNTPAGSSGGSGSSSGGGGGSSSGVSQQDMYNQLMAVGYNGPTDDASIQAAYARTVNGGNAPGNNGGSPSDPPQSGQGQQIFNQQAQQAAQSVAQQAATNAYNQALLAMNSTHYANMDQATKDQLAFDKAKEAYTESITTAGLTGTFNGAPTQAAILQQAGLTGTYNGAPTEAAREFDIGANQAAINQQDQTTQGYLNLLSTLKGPNDPFQYLRTLQGTPNGMADIVNAAAGRYQLGGTASGAIAPRATIQGQIDNMNNAQSGTSQSTQDLNVQGLPLASQIDSRAYNQMLPSQQQALWSAYQYGGPSGAMNPADAQAMYKQAMPTYGGPTQGGVKLFTA
jgi:hypothetical protein